MKEFAKEFEEEIQKAILEQIRDVRFVEHWAKVRRHVPEEIVHQIWDSISWDDVVAAVSMQLADRLSSVIVQSMLTEAKTDVKKLLSVQGMREGIRMKAYPAVMEAIKDAGSAT